MPKHSYKTEVDLCAAFIVWASAEGWTAYPETCDWDILLVAADGEQVGVQAKLRFNATLLRQVLQGTDLDTGPDRRAVLLPAATNEVIEVCNSIGILVFEPMTWSKQFRPELDYHRSFDWNPKQRCKLPAYVPDSIAGSPAPVRLTEWKLKALQLCAMLEIKGEICRQDFKNIGIDPRHWLNPAPTYARLLPAPGRRGFYIRGPRLDFEKQHPRNYAEILAALRTRHSNK